MENRRRNNHKMIFKTRVETKEKISNLQTLVMRKRQISADFTTLILPSNPLKQIKQFKVKQTIC